MEDIDEEECSNIDKLYNIQSISTGKSTIVKFKDYYYNESK
jgi:hypothetical protein